MTIGMTMAHSILHRMPGRRRVAGHGVKGESLALPGRHAIFPPVMVQMLAVGEETGALDTTLTKVADLYDQEVEATVQALTSLIEPILIAVMGA